MMSFAALITAILFAQAPVDVPKEHWAFPAVDALFREGLLKGYPSGKHPVLRLDKTAKIEVKEMVLLRDKWKRAGIYIDGWGHKGHRDPSRYELAVEVHVTWGTVQDVLKSPKEMAEKKQIALSEMPALAYAISAYNFELTRLGADTGKMIETLNDLLDARDRLFLGSRQ
ncbi:MAG: S-layer homology domain-containing protein [Chlorobia bacterium]|nr:S-layer homology domain-containing protein [Fimbriimonadaceae bacterium]